jgi:hypothetical protein
MIISCDCGNRLRVNDDLVGKRVKCPACGAVLPNVQPGKGARVADEASEALPNAGNVSTLSPRNKATEESPSIKKKKKRKKKESSQAMVWVVGGVAALLTVGAVVAVLIMSRTGKGPSTPPKNEVVAMASGQKAPQQPAAAGAKTLEHRSTGVKSPVQWVADQGLLAQLGEETSIPQNPGYSFRIPKGYVQRPLELSPSAALVLSGARWESPPRPDGSVTRLLVMMGKAQPGERLSTLDQFAADVLGSRSDLVGPLTLSQVEHGKIGDLNFARQRWQARHPSTGMKSHGFVYVARDGLQEVAIDTQDIEPHSLTTLPLAEAATLTFAAAKAILDSAESSRQRRAIDALANVSSTALAEVHEIDMTTAA